MSHLCHIPALIDQCRVAANVGALTRILESFCLILGYRWFSLSYLGKPSRSGNGSTCITNYQKTPQGMVASDPFDMNEYLFPALANRVSSVLWDEVINDNDVISPHKRKVTELARSGLKHGVIPNLVMADS